MQQTNVNLSLNGISGTLWEIRRQEASHFYLGYRQSILIINALEKNLKVAEIDKKKTNLLIQKETQKLTTVSDAEREILLDEIELIKDSLAESELLIRDTQFELVAAISEKVRIEQTYPELVTLDYEEIQQKYSQEAFLGKLTRSVMISLYAAHNGISESIAETLIDSNCLSVSDQLKLSMLLESKKQQLLPVVPDASQS